MAVQRNVFMASQWWTQRHEAWKLKSKSPTRCCYTKCVLYDEDVSQHLCCVFSNVYKIFIWCYLYVFHYMYWNIYIYIFIQSLVDQNHCFLPCNQLLHPHQSCPMLCIWQLLANAEPVPSPWMLETTNCCSLKVFRHLTNIMDTYYSLTRLS